MISIRRARGWLLLFVIGMVAGPAMHVAAQAPPPQVVQLHTSDGVQLTITYYPAAVGRGSPLAKQVTPVVMLHDFKATRSIFASLATRLQTPVEGEPDRPLFAVVTVDLRGHGNSTMQVFPNGFQHELDPAKLDKAGAYAMANLDMEEVRRFLVTKNDAGELNLNKLCLLGAGMGANVAANWAAQDWLAPPLAIGKQGQDVKALVLISPRWSFEGLSFQVPMRLRPLKQGAAWMLIYGSQDAKVATDVRRISRQLEAAHPTDDGDRAASNAAFVVLDLPSKLQGDSLLTQSGASVEEKIVAFFIKNVASKEMPWTTRRHRVP